MPKLTLLSKIISVKLKKSVINLQLFDVKAVQTDFEIDFNHWIIL